MLVGEQTADSLDLDLAMRELRSRGVSTILCEGGPTLASALLDAALVQEVVWFVAPTIFNRRDAQRSLFGGHPRVGVQDFKFHDVERKGDSVMLRAFMDNVAMKTA